MLGRYSKNDLGRKGPFRFSGLKQQHILLIFMFFAIHFFLLALKPMGVLSDVRPVIASFFGFAGFIVIWLGFYLARGLLVMKRNYLPSSAIVVDYAPSFSKGVYLVVKYDTNGSCHTVTTLNKSRMIKRGKTVNILFNPKAVSEVFLKKADLYYLPFLVSAMGIGFVYASFYFAWNTLTR